VVFSVQQQQEQEQQQEASCKVSKRSTGVHMAASWTLVPALAHEQ
jgi:hypothetical protein